MVPTIPAPARVIARNALWTYGRATAAARPLPNFLILGAQKAGTTVLYAYLREHPALTAVSISAFLLNGKTEKTEPAVARGVQYILSQAKPNGSICLNGKPSVTLPNYNTSLCLIALAQTKNPAYRPAIDRASRSL